MCVYAVRELKLGAVKFGDAVDDGQAQPAARLGTLVESMEAAEDGIRAGPPECPARCR
jgi:hypothetical protein